MSRFEIGTSRRALAATLTLVAIACAKDLVAPVVAERLDVRLVASSDAGSALTMDLHPGTIDLARTGAVWAVLMSTSDFAAPDVAINNVRLVVGGLLPGAPVARHGDGSPGTMVNDFDRDGRADLAMLFSMSDLIAAGLAGGNPLLTLQDQTSETRRFRATDPAPSRLVGGANVAERVTGVQWEMAPQSTRSARIRLVNDAGHGVGGLAVRWTIASGGGTVGNGAAEITTRTGQDGVTEVSWTAGSGGGQRLVATTPGLSGSPITFAGVVRESDGTITVDAQLQSGNAATATIGAAGGTVSATGSDGTTYTLVVPPDALLDPVAITVTPADIANAPLAQGATFGVHFAPEGLLFVKPARLDVRLPASPGKASVGFAYTGTGSEFHLMPTSASASGGTVSFAIPHFSGAGGGPGFGELSPPLVPPPAVVDMGSALEALAIIQETTRIMQELNQPYDPSPAIAEVLRAWYDVAVKPRLEAARTEDDKLELAVTIEQLWEQTVQSTGVSDADIQARVEAARTLMVAGLQNAIAQTKTRCRANEALSEAARVLRWQQMAEALGLPDASNGLTEGAVRAALCVQARLDGPPTDPELSRGQTTTISFRPRVQFQTASAFRSDDAGARLAHAAGKTRASGPAVVEGDTTFVGSETAAGFALAVAPVPFVAPEIPFYVSVTMEGTTATAPLTVTTSPGDDVEVSVTPLDGTATVRVVVQACMRAPSLERLNDVCEERTETYQVEGDDGRIITGNVTIRSTAEAAALADVVEITGNLLIGDYYWDPADISLAGLSRLRRVGGDVEITGGTTSLAGLESLQQVGSLSVGSPRLRSLAGLSGLEDAGKYLMLGAPEVTTLAGLEKLRNFSEADPATARNPFNAQFYGYLSISGCTRLVDASALSGLLPKVRGLSLSFNPVLDLSPFATLTSLPLYLQLSGPEWTSLNAFANLRSVGSIELWGPEALPNLTTYSLPGLVEAGTISIWTHKTPGAATSLTSVSFPALTTIRAMNQNLGRLMIQALRNENDPAQYAAGILDVSFPVLVNATSIAIERTTGMSSISLPSLNAPTAGVSINDNVGMPTITLGTVGNVSIFNGAPSRAPRPALEGRKEDLTKITIASANALSIEGAHNWTAFGPNIGTVREALSVSAVEVLNYPPSEEADYVNLRRVCSWMRNVPIERSLIEFPQAKAISLADAVNGVVGGRGNLWAMEPLCAGLAQ